MELEHIWFDELSEIEIPQLMREQWQEHVNMTFAHMCAGRHIAPPEIPRLELADSALWMFQ